MSTAPLYARLLGSSWARVAEPVRLAHTTESTVCARTRSGGTHGRGYAGERVTHAMMGILYGAMVANLIPVLIRWWALPTGLVIEWVEISDLLRGSLFVMAAGVFLSGLRDLYAAVKLPYGSWPWKTGTSAAGRG